MDAEPLALDGAALVAALLVDAPFVGVVLELDGLLLQAAIASATMLEAAMTETVFFTTSSVLFRRSELSTWQNPSGPPDYALDWT